MKLATVVVCSLLGVVAQAQEGQGFAEVRVALTPGVEGKVWQVVERVRPTLTQSLSERIRLTATVEAGLAQGRNQTDELQRVIRQSELGPLLETYGVSFPEYENRTLRLNGADDYLDVDRLYLDVYGERFDLRVGRQALNWGSGQFFNPTDPFPEVLLAEPWRPRRGINSARLNVPFGEANDVSAVLATDDLLQELRAAARVRFNWNETDFALVGAWRGENRNALIGVDLRGNFGVGWWVEAAYLVGRSPHEEIVVGIDYSFPILERAVVFAQFYRNGAGAKEPSAATLLASRGSGLGGGQGLFSDGEPDPFAPFTSGQNYGLLGATLAFNPELSGSLAVLQSLNDGSGFAVPTVNYAVLDWLEVAASAQLPYALTDAGGEFKPTPETLQLQFTDPLSRRAYSVDLNGLVPTATVTLWSRASF